jgi:hypothetical protein
MKYDTVFEPPQKPFRYNPDLENTQHFANYKFKIIPENNNTEIYKQNLAVLKNDVRVFNYVGREIRYLPKEDSYKY